jgi:hypothetical protein
MSGCLVDIGAQMIPNKRTCVFQIKSGRALSLVTTRCTQHKGHNYWHVYSRESTRAHIRVVARLKPENDGLLDFYHFPNGVLKDARLSLGACNAIQLSSYRFGTLSTITTQLRCTEVEDYLPTETHPSATAVPRTSDAWRLARFAALQTATAHLIADEDFRNLIRGERLALIPDVLRRHHLTLPQQLLGLSVADEYFTRLLNHARVKRFIETGHNPLCAQLSLYFPKNELALLQRW